MLVLLGLFSSSGHITLKYVPSDPTPPRAGGHSPLRQRCGHLSLADCLESVSETTAYGADRIMFSSGILDNFTKTSDFHSERMFS